MKKKVLIISMTAGQGHNKIAKYYQEKLNDNYESKIIQLYGYSKKAVEKQNNIFLTISTKFRKSYHFFWKMALNRSNRLRYHPNLMSSGTRKCRKYIENEIKEYNPDYIISTHIYAGGVLCYLKRKNRLVNNIEIYQIVTDFCLVPYYEESILVDKLIIPSKKLDDALLKKGFKEDQFIYYKYPNNIQKPQESISELKEKLSIPSDQKIITHISGGSAKASSIKYLKYAVKSPYFFINICGNNNKEYTKINKYLAKNKVSNVLNLGFVKNINEYLEVSDIAFLSGSANLIVEALTLNKPILIRSDAIINEKVNGEMLSQNGMGVFLDKFKNLDKAIETIVENYNFYLENIKKFNSELPEFPGFL